MSFPLQKKPANATTRTTGRDPATESARPFRGRRLSWEEFHKLMAEVANDNGKLEEAAA